MKTDTNMRAAKMTPVLFETKHLSRNSYYTYSLKICDCHTIRFMVTPKEKKPVLAITNFMPMEREPQADQTILLATNEAKWLNQVIGNRDNATTFIDNSRTLTYDPALGTTFITQGKLADSLMRTVKIPEHIEMRVKQVIDEAVSIMISEERRLSHHDLE